GGFAVVSIRSGRFRVKYQGTEQVITGPDGHPLSALEVFIVKASPAISKTFYERGYEEGSDTPPDCFSHDGIAPDLAAPKPQCDVCARCPKNVFGRSEEHTSELQSRENLVCRLLLEKKKKPQEDRD